MLEIYNNVWKGYDCEERKFDSAVTFRNELQQIVESGIAYISVVEGICHTRPMINPIGSCVVFVLHLSPKLKKPQVYKLIYEEAQYVPLCFS